MATMASMVDTMLNKIARQAARLQYLASEKRRLEKLANEWERHAIMLTEKMQDALDIIETVATANGPHMEQALAFIEKWAAKDEASKGE